MPTNTLTPKQKKLKNLRTILWIVFTAIAVTILLVSSLSVPVALLINKTSNFSSLMTGETGMILLSLAAVIFVKIAISGIICLVIYYIFKYRLEKDDDLFL
jgi:Sec-independent protein secretion pathway component TatC